MNDNYVTCAECGERVLADSTGAACEECTDRNLTSPRIVSELFDNIQDLFFGKESN